MEDGQQNNFKVGFIVQARMKSTRLPGKILLPLPLNNGKPLIQWIIDSLKKSKYYSGENIIFATSTDSENDKLEKYLEANKINCYRGDEDNVLSRFIAITEERHFDIIVRLTGDNPIIDYKILDEAIQFHLTEKNQYSNTVDLPIGMNFEIVNAASLLTLKIKSLSNDDKEHVTLFIKNNDYKKGTFVPSYINNALRDIRLTVDYASDFVLISTMFSTISSDISPNYEFVEKCYGKFQWLFEINRANFQKQQFINLKDEINESVRILNYYDYDNCSRILIDFSNDKL